MLIRFRIHFIAKVADVQKAFKYRPEMQRQSHTILLAEGSEECYYRGKVYQYCRVLFGIISSLFLLVATINHHLQQSDKPIAKENLYVNNLITCINILSEAEFAYREAKSLFSGAAMNIREWTQQFMSLLPPEDRITNCEQKVY